MLFRVCAASFIVGFLLRQFVPMPFLPLHGDAKIAQHQALRNAVLAHLEGYANLDEVAIRNSAVNFRKWLEKF